MNRLASAGYGRVAKPKRAILDDNVLIGAIGRIDIC